LIVFVIAHPDDEIFCANLIKLASDRQWAITVVCVTSGERGRFRKGIQDSGPEGLGRTREDEMKSSLEPFESVDLKFLRQPDTGFVEPGEPSDAEPDVDGIHDVLANELASCEFQILVTHGSEGEYGHPMHLAIHGAVRRLGHETGKVVLSFCANRGSNTFHRFTNRHDIADFSITVKESLSPKRHSLQCHRSQWPVFLGEYKGEDHHQLAVERFLHQSMHESYRIVVNRPGTWESFMANAVEQATCAIKRHGMAIRLLVFLMNAIYLANTAIGRIRMRLGLGVLARRFVIYPVGKLRGRRD
jgi:LmbE family N-acetylglucosaminyl deacetylase